MYTLSFTPLVIHHQPFVQIGPCVVPRRLLVLLVLLALQAIPLLAALFGRHINI